MCGIIGYIGQGNPKNVLLDGLKRLEYRGYDSAGIAVIEPKGVEVYRSEGRLHFLEERLADKHFAGTVGVGHTRWATHGAPTETNAHPHRVGHITLVHNGIIENYLDHKERLRALGRSITTDTDSEIVAHLFDLEVAAGHSLKQALVSVLPTLKGSYSFVILNDREPELIAGVRNGCPLLAGIGEKESYVASDVQAILHRTDRILYLHDGEFALCWREKVALHDFQGTTKDRAVETIHWTPDQMEKAGYRHYMLKEIHEQPRAITNTLESNIDHGLGIVSLADLAPWEERLKAIKRICIVACGTARHAGLIGKDYLERFAKIPVDVDFGSEFRYRNPILEDGTLLVLVSQSGETADTLAALREGTARKIPTLSICNVRGSTLARESDVVLFTNAGPEIGVASTKAFTTQLTVLYMLAVHLAHLRGSQTPERCRELTQDILQLPILMEHALQMESEIEKIAQAQDTEQDTAFFFYMGRGINYPIALEGALKLKEISYLHAEGYPAGELKHGPIALIDRHTTVVVLTPKDRPARHDGESAALSRTIYEKLMSNLQEVKSRGGKIFSIGTDEDETFAREASYFAKIPKAPWALNPILLTVPIQFLAYYIALQRGTDVDKPRNLAKSVTVE